MIIQALVQRYEDTQEVPQGWGKRNVSYALDISQTGELLGVLPLEYEAEVQAGKKTKKVLQKRKLILPEAPVRTAGIKSAFLCDDASFLFAKDEKRGPAKFEADRDLHLQILQNIDTPQATAIKAWFAAGPTDKIDAYVGNVIPEKALGSSLFIFQVNGQRVAGETLDPAIREAWNTHYINTGEAEWESIRCLATGRQDTPERIHGKIKLRGGQSSGSNLVSVNAESFASYGKTAKDRAADIGKYAAFAHVTALNDLLQNAKQRQFIGEDTLVFWTEGNSQPEVEVMNLLLQPEEGDEEKLSSIMQKVANAQFIDIEGCEMNRRFYLLCLSPNAARISVRFFHVDSFGHIINNLLAHYRNMDIINDNSKFEYLPLWLLLGETTVSKKSADAAPLLGGQLIKGILTGARYPQTLYNAMLMRIRAGESVNRAKAAVVKAVLIKNYNERTVTTNMLNEESGNKPYVLGRLFATLERLQERASGGGLSATIRDKYFSGACANPVSAFPMLLKLSMHHTAKLGNQAFFEKLKGVLMAKLDMEDPFPKALGMEDQGRFILGYYHQRQAFFTKKEETADE